MRDGTLQSQSRVIQQEGIILSSPSIPTAEQLAAARSKHWHQNGEALLTFENMRSWINVAGLVLFTPRTSQLPAPSPSLVEGVLGAANPEPSLPEMEQAKSLLARLVAEGIAVPLNLLGVAGGTGGETPDFVVSAPVFSYIFTLRGDKAWKQPPATSGAMKVSPLAAAAFEALSRRAPLSAYDLTTELGKEVTESAVLRALNELWAHLRVIPIGQPHSEAQTTLWEPTSARFTKHIKAGANAGQPSALSALISLYLGSAMLATEEEIETFLSPLAARSRIRDVIHALLGARELETLVIEGKTLLHVSGSLPAFATPAAEDFDSDSDVHAKPVELIAVEAGVVLAETDAPRIKKFVAKPRKLGTGFPSDYGRKFSGAPLGTERERRPFEKAARPARPLRPAAGKPAFDRPASEKPAFDKPWKEDRPARPATALGGATDRPERSYAKKPKPDGGEGRSAFASRPASRGGDSRPARRTFTSRQDGEGSARTGASSGDPSAGRGKTFSKPGTFGRRREAAGDSRPPRREFSDRGAERPNRASGGERPYRSDRSDRSDRASRADRPSGTFSGRSASGGPPRAASKTAGSGPRTPGSFSARPRPSFGAKPGFTREGNGASATGERGLRPAFRKFDAPRGDRPARPRSFESTEGASERPARSYSKPAAEGVKKPFTKREGSGSGAFGAGFAARKPGGSAKPAGTFAKFADGKNPFRKPGKPGGKGGSFKGKKTSFSASEKPAYRERKPRAGE